MNKVIVMSLNIDLFYFINNGIANPFFDAIMPILCDCGGFVTLLALCILAILVLKYYLKNEKYLKIAKMCLYALVLSGIIAACLKLAYQSPRPFMQLEHVRQLVVPTDDRLCSLNMSASWLFQQNPIHFRQDTHPHK